MYSALLREAKQLTQLTLPCCSKCGALHTGSGWCQVCIDDMTVGWLIAYAVYNAELDDQQGLDYAHEQRPELFERGVLPDRWHVLAPAIRAEAAANYIPPEYRAQPFKGGDRKTKRYLEGELS